MRYGNSGKLLFIDLTNSTFRTEILPEDQYKNYPGGKALAAFLLLKYLKIGNYQTMMLLLKLLFGILSKI